LYEYNAICTRVVDGDTINEKLLAEGLAEEYK